MKEIHLWGVKQNNLKNIEVKIPLGQLTVICGPSGSGKSSLAFETLFAEGQRRFIESMSNYARQFLNKAPKPDIEGINNIPPAISIEQKNTVKSSRSTVVLRRKYSIISVYSLKRSARLTALLIKFPVKKKASLKPPIR
jgi:excinuclease ABC subunit A